MAKCSKPACWDRAERIVRLLVLVADEAVKLITALHVR